MLKSHEVFHSVNGKRQILIADDEMINREIELLLCQPVSIYSRLWFFQWLCMDVRVGL